MIRAANNRANSDLSSGMVTSDSGQDGRAFFSLAKL